MSSLEPARPNLKMRRPKSEITWLDKDAYIGTEVTFPEKGSRWKLERKISDMRCLKQIHLFSEARAVFVASNVGGTFPKKPSSR